LRRRHIVQKNSRPGHPTTCDKAERFQQTMNKWLRAQPAQPSTVAELQALLDRFAEEYNHRRPHRSLPHRATPAALYDTMPKAVPGPSRDPDTHDRIRHDIVDKAGSVTLRHCSRLHHIGVGRTHAGTCVILLVQDLQIRVECLIGGIEAEHRDDGLTDRVDRPWCVEAMPNMSAITSIGNGTANSATRSPPPFSTMCAACVAARVSTRSRICATARGVKALLTSRRSRV
jgi:hypothetical protein